MAIGNGVSVCEEGHDDFRSGNDLGLDIEPEYPQLL